MGAPRRLAICGCSSVCSSTTRKGRSVKWVYCSYCTFHPSKPARGDPKVGVLIADAALFIHQGRQGFYRPRRRCRRRRRICFWLCSGATLWQERRHKGTEETQTITTGRERPTQGTSACQIPSYRPPDFVIGSGPGRQIWIASTEVAANRRQVHIVVNNARSETTQSPVMMSYM